MENIKENDYSYTLRVQREVKQEIYKSRPHQCYPHLGNFPIVNKYNVLVRSVKHYIKKLSQYTQ